MAEATAGWVGVILVAGLAAGFLWLLVRAAREHRRRCDRRRFCTAQAELVRRAECGLPNPCPAAGCPLPAAHPGRHHNILTGEWWGGAAVNDLVELLAMVIHERRHPLGYGQVCDSCRRRAARWLHR